jgi:hypothetical protein
MMTEVRFEVGTEAKFRRSGTGAGTRIGEHRYLACVDSCVPGRASVHDDGDISYQLRYCSKACGKS